MLQETPNKTDRCWAVGSASNQCSLQRSREKELSILFHPHILQVGLFESPKGEASPHHLLPQTCSTAIWYVAKDTNYILPSPIIKIFMLLGDDLKVKWNFTNKLNFPCKQHTCVGLRTAWAEGTVKQKPAHKGTAHGFWALHAPMLRV